MSVAPAPQWVPDAERPACRGCQVQFSWLVRRHHCRICGEVYCDVCTRRRVYIGSNELVRVCDSCQSLFRKQTPHKATSPPRASLNPATQERKEQSTSWGMGTGVLLVCAVVCAAMDWCFAPQEEESLRWWRGFLVTSSLAVCAYHAFKQLQRWLKPEKNSTPPSRGPTPTTTVLAPTPTAPTTVPSANNPAALPVAAGVSESARGTIRKALEKAVPFALEGWDPPQTVYGALLARKKEEGWTLDPIQLEGLVKGVTPQVLCGLLRHSEFKKITQPDTKYTECIERIDNIEVVIEETNLPWPVSNRDVLYVTTSQPYQNGMMIVEENFEHPLRPAVPSPVRARASSVYLMTPEPGLEKTVRLKMSSKFDPRGNIPTSIINALIAQNCKIFSAMNACIASERGKALIEEVNARLT